MEDENKKIEDFKEEENQEKEGFKSQEEELEANIKETSDKFGLDEAMEAEKDINLDEIEIREREIEIRLQEIDVEMDKLDMKIQIDETDIDAIEAYNNLKQEMKNLLKEKKNLRKQQIKETIDPNQKSLDNLSIWIIVYGITVALLCSPLLSNVWVKFATLIINAASDTIGAMDPNTVLGKIVVVLLVFAFPILLHVISWVLYLNATKSKTDKFAFRIAWIIQALVTVITMVIALVNVFKG